MHQPWKEPFRRFPPRTLTWLSFRKAGISSGHPRSELGTKAVYYREGSDQALTQAMLLWELWSKGVFFSRG